MYAPQDNTKAAMAIRAVMIFVFFMNIASCRQAVPLR